jgi:hypothetical protein
MIPGYFRRIKKTKKTSAFLLKLHFTAFFDAGAGVEPALH